MKPTYDVAIVGLGVMGCSAAYYLSKRKAKVLGLDRYTPPHVYGSSHGQSRIIREAYFEDSRFVPFIQRAYANWKSLEEEWSSQLFLQTGGLMAGKPSGFLVSGSRRSAELYNLDYENLDASAAGERFPAFRLGGDQEAVYEPRAGVLFAEECVNAYMALAEHGGADLRCNEKVVSWRSDASGVVVQTDKREYAARQLLLAAGPWMRRMMPDLPLRVERQFTCWFDPASDPESFKPDRFPVFAIEFRAGQLFYGVPDLGKGVKVSVHHGGNFVDPDHIVREVEKNEIELLRAMAEEYLPGANGKLLNKQVCMYTSTPDHLFIVDRHPDYANVAAASPCSGHGFKFASVIGEILSDLLTEGGTDLDISMFSINRFAARGA